MRSLRSHARRVTSRSSTPRREPDERRAPRERAGDVRDDDARPARPSARRGARRRRRDRGARATRATRRRTAATSARATAKRRVPEKSPLMPANGFEPLELRREPLGWRRRRRSARRARPPRRCPRRASTGNDERDDLVASVQRVERQARRPARRAPPRSRRAGRPRRCDASARTADGTSATATTNATACAAYALAPLSPSSRALRRRRGVGSSVLSLTAGRHESVQLEEELAHPLAGRGRDELQVDAALREAFASAFVQASRTSGRSALLIATICGRFASSGSNFASSALMAS